MLHDDVWKVDQCSTHTHDEEEGGKKENAKKLDAERRSCVVVVLFLLTSSKQHFADEAGNRGKSLPVPFLSVFFVCFCFVSS